MKRRLKTEFIITGFIFIVITTMILLLLPKNIYVFDFDSDKTIALNTNFDPEIVSACYGSRFFYNFSPCFDITKEIEIVGEVDLDNVGNYILIYKIDYKGIKKNYNQVVRVIDDQKPLIDFLGNEEVFMCPNNSIYEPEFIGYDNQDGDISSKVKRYIEKSQYVYEVEDSSGNITKSSRNINYNDTTNPSIELTGGNNINIPLNQEYVEPGFVVTDNCNDNLNEKVIVEGKINPNKEGIYLLIYSVLDDSKNFASTTRRVIVGNPKINEEKKIVCLTFDDGPGPYTIDILDVLKKYNVKATFFVTGQFPKHSDVLKRIKDDNHSIGLHTYSHVFKNIYASEENFFKDIDKLNELIKLKTGTYSEILRFAGGSSNTSSYFNRGIMTTLAKKVEERGYKYFDWNVDSMDSKYYDSTTIANNVINSLKVNKNYFIVLQHDTKKANIEATKLIIEDGLKRGYVFQTLSKNSLKIHHGINN